MNICTILLACISALCLLGVNASKTPYKMPANVLEKTKAAGEKCIKEVGAPIDFLEKMFPWNYAKNELNEKSLFCLCTTLGLANQDGTFKSDKVARVFLNSDKIEDIKKAFAECSGLKGNNQYETAYIISDCFFDKAPITLLM